MKTMLFLGAVSSFLFAFTPTTSFAQSSPSISGDSVAMTCRSVLQGSPFTQVQNIASPPCCYVGIEEDWYKANGVRVSSIYQRSNGDTYRAESCDLISNNRRIVDQTTTGSIGGASGVPVAGQPITNGGGMPGANNGIQLSRATGIFAGDSSGSNTGGNGGGNTGGSVSRANTGGNAGWQTSNGGGQNSGANTGGNSGAHNGGGHTGDDGNNGHGNDVGGVDPSNPGNSTGTANHGSTGGGNAGEKGNNGFGNGGGDGSPNGMQDQTR